MLHIRYLILSFQEQCELKVIIPTFFLRLGFVFFFLYKELALFCQVDVLDNPFKEDHLVLLDDACILRGLTEILVAHS